MITIGVYDKSSPTVVAIEGEFGAGDAVRLADVLAEYAAGEPAKVAIDLSGLKFIDSSGLSALVNFVTRSRLSDGQVVLVAPSIFVAGILHVTRLDKWFEISTSLEEAKSRLREM